MILSVIKAALCAVHGTKKIEQEVSGYGVLSEKTYLRVKGFLIPF
jgi:hypothetical protein